MAAKTVITARMPPRRRVNDLLALKAPDFADAAVSCSATCTGEKKRWTNRDPADHGRCPLFDADRAERRPGWMPVGGDPCRDAFLAAASGREGFSTGSPMVSQWKVTVGRAARSTAPPAAHRRADTLASPGPARGAHGDGVQQPGDASASGRRSGGYRLWRQSWLGLPDAG